MPCSVMFEQVIEGVLVMERGVLLEQSLMVAPNPGSVHLKGQSEAM